MTKNITSEEVIKFHIYMSQIYEFKMFDKSKKIEMHLIARFIECFVPISSKKFLEQYSTTIGNRVYLSYTIGKGTKTQLFDQICTLVHETQHVVDFCENQLNMASYLFHRLSRSKLETKALSTYLYLYWWYYNRIPNIKKLTNQLRYYGLTETDRQNVYKRLKMEIPIVKRGYVRNPIVKKAIKWLNRNCK